MIPINTSPAMLMTTVAIHQPQYLPWMPYFQKLSQADCFVFLDNVQYQSRGLQNRNQVKGPNGAVWLTVPVKSNRGDLISQIPMVDGKWKKKHTATIEQFYSKAPFFDLYSSRIKPVIMSEISLLSELNKQLINVFVDILDIQTKLLDASSLTVSGSKQEMIIDICREVNATVYLSGCGAKDYQSSNNFENHGISLRYHDSVLPTYDQCFARQGFVPGMSALDTVLNLGEDAAQYL